MGKSLNSRIAKALISATLLIATTGVAAKYVAPALQPVPQQRTNAVDPLLETSWHLEAVGIFEAWKVTQGSPRIKIGIVDSGIDYNHPELAASIFRKPSDPINDTDDDGNGFTDDFVGWNFNDEMPLPYDDNGHGTFIAGIVAGQYNNGIGGAGVCPGCLIVPLRFMDKDGFGDTVDAVRSINYAVKERVSVLNLSFAGEGYDRDLSKALQAAAEADIVVVVAAGNDGENLNNKDVYPPKFRFHNMISVAAVKRDDNLWSGSNYGDTMIDLAAPGTTIWGPWIDGKWYRSQGTSFAAPIVTGAVGLIRSANPSLRATQVVEIIEATVRETKALQDKVRTGGIIDVQAAMRCAIHPSLPCLNSSQKK